MKIGVGGGIGPFHAGVSTRGFGAGMGPIRVGGGWGKRGGGGSGGLMPVALILVVIVFAVSWPYYLGTWIAVQLGAGPTSTTRGIIGWLFEATYVLTLFAALMAYVSRKSALQAAANKQLRLQQLTAELDELERRKDEARHRLTEAVGECQKLQELMRRHPKGRPDPAVPAKEALLASFEHVSLVEPRLSYRGGPRLQTPIDRGTVWVTDAAIRYRSDVKSVTWRFDKMLEAKHETGLMTFPVSNRKLVSGIALPTNVEPAFVNAVWWGRSLYNGEDSANVRRELQSTIDELAGALQMEFEDVGGVPTE